MKRARLIHGVTDNDANLFYITRFSMPDPSTCLVLNGKSCFFVGGFEYPRACKEAKVDRVVNSDLYRDKALKKYNDASLENMLALFLKDLKVKNIEMPQNSPFYLVDALRKRGFNIVAAPNPFFPERFIKDSVEKGEIEKIQRLTFASIDLAESILKQSKIKGRSLVWRGKKLTSEILRNEIDKFLFERGAVASQTIVAAGEHCLDPHDIGSGAISKGESIIIDVFPQSRGSHYYGDATRTFCKGSPSERLLKMYNAVRDAQALAISKIRDGVNGRKIHESVHDFFIKKGFPLKNLPNRKDGFIHGTGHGLGLEIHEDPLRISFVDYILRKGNVTSVEPGLYYTGIGGVRIEDLAYVTKNGCEILGKYKKELVV